MSVSKATVMDYRVSTLTITSQYVGDEDFGRSLDKFIADVPTQVVDGPDLVLPLNQDLSVKKHTRRDTVIQIPTAVSWRNRDISICVRPQPHVGRRGTGSVVLGNFRNCLTFRGGNRVAKVFRNGSIQACGFVDIDEFHSFVSVILPLIGSSGHIDKAATRVHLAICDARLSPSKDPIHLRSLARLCSSRMRAEEVMDFEPSAMSGIKLKLVHPCDSTRQVSVVIRSRGSVKVYCGKPGEDLHGAVASVWRRVCEILDAI